MMERVMELEHYRWADDERPPANEVGTSHYLARTAYRWTAIRQSPDAADEVASVPIVAPPKRAPTSEDWEHHPPERTHPKRTVSSMVRFTPDEFLIVAERARACGRPPARYIREAALGSVPKAKRTAGSAELIRELSAIGSTLQELRTIAGGATGETVAVRCEMVLLNVLDTIRKIG